MQSTYLTTVSRWRGRSKEWSQTLRGNIRDCGRPTPGIVEHNPAFFYHEAFNDSPDEVEELENRYRSGTVSDSEVKSSLVRALNRFLDPIRERRAYFESRPSEIQDALEQGTNRARAVAKETMAEVREAMRVVYF